MYGGGEEEMKAECLATVLERMVEEGKYASMDEALNEVFEDRARVWQMSTQRRGARGLRPWSYDKPKKERKPKETKKTQRTREVEELAEEYARVLREDDEEVDRLAKEYEEELRR